MEKGSRLSREIWGVVVFAFALLVLLSLFSYDPRDGSLNTPSGSVEARNWGGIVGAYLADLLLQGLGLSSYLLFFLLLFLSCHFLLGRPLQVLRPVKWCGFGLFLWSAGTLAAFVRRVDVARDAGGVAGEISKNLLVALFSPVGSYLILFAVLVLSLMLMTQGSLVSFKEELQALGVLVRKYCIRCMRPVAERWRKRKKGQRGGENVKKEQRQFIPPPILLKEEVREEETRGSKKKPVIQEQLDFPDLGGGYKLPTAAFLDSPEASERVKIDKETLEANSLILQKKLADFGVEGEVVAVRPGPVITMYEFKPAAGVKVRRIVTLADDLSMALRAVSVRILAPIPGESVVGIEIPNPRREKVFLREVIESDAFQGMESTLTLALGKDIAGTPFMADLAKMPHLLVAGATGTGKSISINAMILSILYKASPQDVQFIMVDPKMLELTVYDSLPHLLVPVVTDPKKAAAALFWAMDEMDRRYRLMREKGARNIEHYNHLLEKETADKRNVIELREPEEVEGEENGMAGDSQDGAPLIHERLPRIVIVVDELADLMMSVGRDIEEYITRLAQKARAAGIHMILATQRPSVDVITGLIKANFPARLSFQVTSRVDSRTILDSIGAERLLGDGDLLFLPPGTARLTRVHGAYVSDQEIRKVTAFINQQAKPRYRPEVFESRKTAEGGDGEDDFDEMYDLAVQLVTESSQASISMLQRRLRVGYNRAARMIEQMEREGVVGPAEGGKPREVYARKIDG